MRHWFRRHRIHIAGAAAVVAAAVTIGVNSSTSGSGGGVVLRPWSPPTAEQPGDLGAACGVERWPVKVGTDPGARTVGMTPMPTTIAALAAYTAPASPSGTVRYGPETQVWTIHTTVTAYKEEADFDVHLAVTDGAGHTMIAEIPGPHCVGAGSPFGYGIARARTAWLARHPMSASYVADSEKVTITGPALFDKLHGQRGVAANGIEIHPVLSVTFG